MRWREHGMRWGEHGMTEKSVVRQYGEAVWEA